MPTAYIVAGPISIGNRLLLSILCRSGCDGVSSTEQPQTIEQLPHSTGRPYAVLRHEYLAPWVDALEERGYDDVVVIIPIREPIANVRSMLKGHSINSFEQAYRDRVYWISHNIIDAISHGWRLEIITYEGLSEQFLKEWLPIIGLPYVPGLLNLPGQNAPNEIVSQNAKHYQ